MQFIKKIVVLLTLIVSSLAHTAFGAMVLPPPTCEAVKTTYLSTTLGKKLDIIPNT